VKTFFTLTLTGYPPPNYWIDYSIIQSKNLSREGAMREAQTYLDKVLRQKEMKVDWKGGKD